MYSAKIIILVGSILSFGLAKAQECVPRDFGHGTIVCVCNSTYCDSASRDVPERGKYRSYESNKSGKRFYQQVSNFENNPSDHNEVNSVVITLHPNNKSQEISGFGGAFTDSAGINIMKMTEQSQNRILEAYFGLNGSRYNYGRVPIGGSDFSMRAYTYVDTKDPTLKSFQLAPEDTLYKIPLMRKALQINPELRFVSAPWSAPPWMKTNGNYVGFGFLQIQYYQTYADYLVKFLLAYKEQGLEIYSISTGNEPMDVLFPFFPISSMGWTPRTVSNWIATNLGPTIAASQSNQTKIIIIDDQRINLPWYPDQIFRNERAKNYTSIIGVHFYWDAYTSPTVLDITHDRHPDKEILMTEACVGVAEPEDEHVLLGEWERAETYISDIIESLNHWVNGWIEWNLALDQSGGPNWIHNYVDASIIVNPDADEFYKQPTYYALAHVSKFLTRGSRVIATTTSRNVSHVAVVTPQDEIVIVLWNPDNDTKTVTIRDPKLGHISRKLSPKSIQTIIYKK